MAQVILNNAALNILLRSPAGPVGREIQKRAAQVTELARANASGPILGIDTGDLLRNLHFSIGTNAEGPFALVGSDATHGVPSFSYPGFWDQNGRPWLTNALREVFP